MGEVTVILPRTIDQAVAALVGTQDAVVLAGGTDLMVGMNAGRTRADSVISLRHVEELAGWSTDGDTVTIGARVTYSRLLDGPLATLVPGLAHAARTVGSPQIRNAGTIGGNLATASPAGDTLPVLAALDAIVCCAGAGGPREVPFPDFVIGPKANSLGVDELITGVRVPVAAGPQDYLKVGVRNAMVIAMVSVALVVDLDARRVAVAIGSAGPTPRRAPDAEAWVAGHLDWGDRSIPDPRTAGTFGAMVVEASLPIDDHRGTAAYRRHAVGVLARRALGRAFPGAPR